MLLGADRSTLGTLAAELAVERGRVVGPDPEPGRGYFFRSDHFPLAKIGIPAVSLSDPVEYVGNDPAASKQLKEEYDAKHYHQPSDEINARWDYTGAVDDMRFLAELRMAHREQPRDARVPSQRTVCPSAELKFEG